jgi:hypothetical protein
MKSQAQIDAELERLEKRIPELVASLSPAQVLDAFAAEPESLTVDPPPEQEAYINGRLNCMLAAAGLVPGDPEGEPCPTGIDRDRS